MEVRWLYDQGWQASFSRCEEVSASNNLFMRLGLCMYVSGTCIIAIRFLSF